MIVEMKRYNNRKLHGINPVSVMCNYAVFMMYDWLISCRVKEVLVKLCIGKHVKVNPICFFFVY